MDEFIKTLFDYQRFSNNPKLKSMIDKTSRKYDISDFEISDDILDLNAAGDINYKTNRPSTIIDKEKEDEHTANFI